MKALGELLKNIRYRQHGNISFSLLVRRIVSDSREIKPQDLFVAVRGPCQNGHQFISEAVRRGASVIISQEFEPTQVPEGVFHLSVPETRSVFGNLLAQFYDFPSRHIQLIGVTGTNGKTTTVYLIHHILNILSTCGMIGTIEYRWKDKTIKSGNTTPGPAVLMPILQEMVSDRLSYCVMEVSSHGLDQCRTAGLSFRSAVFTNLTQDHMDYHRNMENYFLAKQKLFTGRHKPESCILNSDDAAGRRLQKETAERAVSFGFDRQAAYRAVDADFSLSRSTFKILNRNTERKIVTPLIMRHNVSNVLAAAAAVCELGFPLADVCDAVNCFRQVPGRLERIDEGQPFSVFVDYAHTPDAMYHILLSASQMKRGRLITVFGCGGDRDKEKRPMMGRVAAQFSDFAILTSDNPRGEDPLVIMDQVENGLREMRGTVIERREDRREAIRLAVETAENDDIVLILGKGHETGQKIGDRTIPFDDRLIVRDCLRERSGSRLTRER